MLGLLDEAVEGDVSFPGLGIVVAAKAGRYERFGTPFGGGVIIDVAEGNFAVAVEFEAVVVATFVGDGIDADFIDL